MKKSIDKKIGYVGRQIFNLLPGHFTKGDLEKISKDLLFPGPKVPNLMKKFLELGLIVKDNYTKSSFLKVGPWKFTSPDCIYIPTEIIMNPEVSDYSLGFLAYALVRFPDGSVRGYSKLIKNESDVYAMDELAVQGHICGNYDVSIDEYDFFLVRSPYPSKGPDFAFPGRFVKGRDFSAIGGRIRDYYGIMHPPVFIQSDLNEEVLCMRS